MLKPHGGTLINKLPKSEEERQELIKKRKL